MIHFLCLHRKALHLTIFCEYKVKEIIITLGVFFLILVVITTFEFFLVGEMAKNHAESKLVIDEEK